MYLEKSNFSSTFWTTRQPEVIHGFLQDLYRTGQPQKTRLLNTQKKTTIMPQNQQKAQQPSLYYYLLPTKHINLTPKRITTVSV